MHLTCVITVNAVRIFTEATSPISDMGLHADAELLLPQVVATAEETPRL
jgi:hypothetical protein